MLSFVPPSRRSLLRESRFALVAPLAALVAYFPAIVVPYGFMDDYYLLAWQRGLEGEFWKTATQFGRPLHALFLSGAFGLAPDIGALRLVRLLGLLGVMLLALLLYYVLRQAELGRWLSTGVCVSVVSLASFQIYVSWAAIFEAPYVAALAGLASLRLRSASGLEGRRALIRRAEASTLLLCALLSYQPAAMFFWVFTAIDVLRPGQELARALRKFCESLAVAAVALFFGYAAVRIGVHFYGGAFSGRTHLVHDFVGKARWFWNEPIVNSLGMFNLVPTASAACAIAVVAAVGILLLHRESGRGALGFLGLAVAFVPLSYTPNLVISENFASYRSTAALAALVTLYLWLGLSGITRALTSSEYRGARRVVTPFVVLALAALASFAALALIVVPLVRPLERVSVHTLTSGPELGTFALLFAILAGTALWTTGDSGRRTWAAAMGALALTAFVLGGVMIAARNVTTLVVKPQSVELQLVRSELSGAGSPGAHRIVFVKPSYADGAAPLVRYDEFGPPSTYFPWVPSPAVRLVLRERLPKAHPDLAILASDQAPASKPAQGDPLVDMRNLRESRVGWSFWTLHAAPRATTAADAPSAR
ncbi:MAG: hypothetical protein QOH23_1613 [Gaiellaceae bacterium]|nr:hypothetical protein [Gaiellaceae bacterium]